MELELNTRLLVWGILLIPILSMMAICHKDIIKVMWPRKLAHFLYLIGISTTWSGLYLIWGSKTYDGSSPLIMLTISITIFMVVGMVDQITREIYNESLLDFLGA